MGIDGFLILGFAYLSFQIINEASGGGHHWKQGEWLINSQYIQVRRGLFGDINLFISDNLNANPVKVVGGLQIVFLLIFYLAFGKLVKIIKNPYVAAILVFSPAIPLVFWVADQAGSVRKELIAFSGLTIFCLGILDKRKDMIVFGSLILCLSFLSHEAMILFIPTTLFIVAMSWRIQQLRITLAIAVLTIFVKGGFSLFYAFENSIVADTEAVCRPLIERNLDREICTGAIEWLAYDSGEGWLEVNRRLSMKRFVAFCFFYFVSILGILYVYLRTNRPLLCILVATLALLPFLPLYLVAVDWGRWISFHVFSTTLLTIMALELDWIRLERKLKPSFTAILVLIGLLVSPNHLINIEYYSAVWSLFTLPD